MNKSRATFVAKWSCRGEQKAVAYPPIGPDGFRYPQPLTQLDLSLGYQVSRRVLLSLNVRNATNVVHLENARGSQTPRYAKEFYHGVFNRIITVGVKGSF